MRWSPSARPGLSDGVSCRQRSYPSLIAAAAAIILSVIHLPCVRGVDLNACYAKLGAPLPPLSPNMTEPSPPSPPLNISYKQCLANCGTGVGNIDWQHFPQNFGVWFLPWISLMFQIPFGAERRSRHHVYKPHLTKACFCEQSP